MISQCSGHKADLQELCLLDMCPSANPLLCAQITGAIILPSSKQRNQGLC